MLFGIPNIAERTYADPPIATFTPSKYWIEICCPSGEWIDAPKGDSTYTKLGKQDSDWKVIKPDPADIDRC